ncbi:MAG TPA: 1,4-dihydroxy-6-naphthoate synthase [Longimicrobiaceae bacterium]|nr:1,4-dihydroxy-6-naphthoate synthase [Longimicrobiaceae bacterium]
MKRLTLGFSPCPNDTFIFHALVHGLLDVPGIDFEPRLDDVETLNRLALEGRLDVTKISFGALPHLLHDYTLLASGGALGRGCGPLVVARRGLRPADLPRARIAIPGRLTTANLLLRLFDPEAPPGLEMPYDRIMPAVAAGQVDAGVIIHESRFTYPAHGLRRVIDLGEWWEGETGHPIPLGAIVARRSLGADAGAIEAAIRASVEHALADPTASADYVRRHAQEMSEEVTRSHIELYVNSFSVDLGPEGRAAVDELMRRAAGAGLLPRAAMDPLRDSATI